MMKYVCKKEESKKKQKSKETVNEFLKDVDSYDPLDDLPEIVEVRPDPIVDDDGNSYIPWTVYIDPINLGTDFELVDENDKPIDTDDGFLYNLYINGPIVEPFHYTRLFYMLRTLKKDDLVNVYINSPGGSINTLVQMVNVLTTLPCMVITNVDGFAESAGAILAMVGDEIIVPEQAGITFHNIRFGTDLQDVGLLRKNLEHNQAIYNALLQKYGAKVLTKTEMNNIINLGTEISITGTEFNKRMEKYKEQSKSK